MTFDDLIRRYATDVAYLAAGLTGTPASTDDLTPEQFTELVQDAADELETHGALGLYGDADDLDEAAARLRAALGVSGPTEDALLDQAARLLEAAESAAADIRLAS